MKSNSRTPYFRVDSGKNRPALLRWARDASYYSSALFLFREGDNPQAELNIENAAKNATTGYGIYREQNAREKQLKSENFEWLKRHNPEITEEAAQELTLYMGSMLNRHSGEHGLFSFYVLNEFLEQTAVESYEEFIDENWSRLYEAMDAGEFRLYEHSKRLMRTLQVKNSVFLIRSRSAAPVRLALEGRTREELLRLSKLPTDKLAATSSLLANHMALLLSPPEDNLPTLNAVLDCLLLAYSKSFVYSEGRTPTDAAALMQEYLNLLNKLLHKAYDDPKQIKPGQLSSAALNSIAKGLLAKAEELQPLEQYLFLFKEQECRKRRF